MTGTLPLPRDVTKEVRALFPGWLGCTLVVGAGAVSGSSTVIGAGILAYCLGSIALGAQSIGHEYSHRTLATLLAQPCDRRRMLLVKAGVLTAMLLTLSLVAWIALFEDDQFHRVWRGPERALLPLFALCGLFVAPCLTMLCRNPLAGVVFTIAAPMCLLIMGDLTGAMLYGFGSAARIDSFKLATLRWGILLMCASAAVCGWRMFMRLEAIDGRGADVQLPRWRRARTAAEAESIAPPAVRRHPLWLLAQKELRLQQMTFVVAGLYVLGYAALSLLRHVAPDAPAVPLGALSLLYFGLLCILIGSLASAEERQLGTLEWQVLLPMAAWRQWTIKAATAFALATLLGLVLPAVLNAVDPSAGDVSPRVWREVAVMIVLLTACSLYVSSLSTSGVRAMVLSLPAGIAALFFIQVIDSIVWWALGRIVGWAAVAWPPRGSRAVAAALQWWMYVLSWVMAAGCGSLLLRFAYLNHRSIDRSFSRVSWQVLSIAAFLTLSGVVTAGVRAWFSLSR